MGYKIDSIRLLHCADTHIGKIHKIMRTDPITGRNLLTLDAENQLNIIIDIAIEEKVDLVVHAGDMFDRVNIKNIDIQEALKSLKRLSAADIPFIAIAGNHDRPFTKGVSSPIKYIDIIDNCYAIPRFDTKKLSIAGKDVAVHGISYLKRDVAREFSEITQKLVNDNPGDYQILLSHQSLEGVITGYEWSSGVETPIQRSVFPVALNYVAMGHIHKRQTLNHPQNEDFLMHYPGSPIKIDFGERKDNKAVSIVTLTNRDTEIDNIPLKTRPFIEVQVKLKNPEESAIVENAIREVVEKNLGKETFLGIRLTGGLRVALRRVTMTNYYREYFKDLAGFKIFNMDSKLNWYDHEGISITFGQNWLKDPIDELKSALDDQTELTKGKKAKLLELGKEIISEVSGGD